MPMLLLHEFRHSQMGSKIFQSFNTRHSITTFFFFFFFFSVFIVAIPLCFCDDNQQYEECRSRLYECGELKGIGYPFWGDTRPEFCGYPGFELKCQADGGGYTHILIDSLEFRVLSISMSTYTMTIARTDFWYETCPQVFSSTTLNHTLFDYAAANRNLTLFYGCSDEVVSQLPDSWNITKKNFTCQIKDTNDTTAFYVEEANLRVNYPPILETWKIKVTLPVRLAAFDELIRVDNTEGDGVSNEDRLEEALNMGFDVDYGAVRWWCDSCNGSGGICISSNSSSFSCFCPNDNKYYPLVCTEPEPGSSNSSKKIILVFAVGGVGILFVMILIIFIFKRKTIEYRLMFKSHANQNIEKFMRNYGSQAPKRYSYSDIKKMTGSFKDKLGQGGYGDVYKGKFGDGRLIAVKVLNTSKGNGEDFINEVGSISQTCHVNIVRLLGFCFERGKKALIYEFLSNGSLENFLGSETPLKASKHLGWEKLYQIAVGIARGLDYLHRGCRTRILHFDVKPHNILLDQDFCPKISDFGLAKLCASKESIVSMSMARGTIGYVAPEVFCRNFGQISHKSDVYSYGMMILEIVGGRQKINGAVNNTSETYFPHWIYKHVEQQEDVGLEDIVDIDENEVTRKMIVVGLWCIQTDPSIRPCMSKVIEMLEGSIEALQIPPKPFLFSASRFPLEPSSFKSTPS